MMSDAELARLPRYVALPPLSLGLRVLRLEVARRHPRAWPRLATKLCGAGNLRRRLTQHGYLRRRLGQNCHDLIERGRAEGAAAVFARRFGAFVN
jgi:hypothetical protein